MIYANQRIHQIRDSFVQKLQEKDFVYDKTGVKTLEIIGSCFIADTNTIFGSVNYDYIDREFEWYNSMSRKIDDFPGGPPEIWSKVSNENGEVNSNYGWALYSQENFNQYQNVIDHLKKDSNTRQALAIYTRPTMHYDSTLDGMSDFMCTNTVQYIIRERFGVPRLHVVVNMRSNDVVFGYRNDYAWQKHVAKKIIKDVVLPEQEPIIYWQVGSLHVYERHFWMVKAYEIYGNHKMSKKEYLSKMCLE